MTGRWRLGLLAYATDTGLGAQTRALHRHLAPAKTMLIDEAKGVPLHREWYPGAVPVGPRPTDDDIDRFLDQLDVVFVCETPVNYGLFERARERGVRTVLQPNYEWLGYLPARDEERRRPLPDLFAAPSPWHLRDLPAHVAARTLHLPVPIDLDELPRRTITAARHFFHVAGLPTYGDRNGTLDFIAAARVAAAGAPELDLVFTVSCQQPTPEIEAALREGGVELVGHVERHADLYRDGDVLVLPRRYGGLCLPAQEAVGCGIPVLMPDIEPNNAWLPEPWLVPAVPGGAPLKLGRAEIETHRVDVEALAELIVAMARRDELVRRMHAEALVIAQAMSWEALRSRYEELLTAVASGTFS
jgi:glycosyltransferase involved in cell wall biosynthesis